MLLLLDNSNSYQSSLLGRGLLFCAVAFPWFFNLALCRESIAPAPSRHRFLPELGALGLSIAYAWHLFILPDKYPDHHLWRGFTLALAAHFLAAGMPFLRRNTHDVFWGFNKTLFLRFLLSTLYTGVIFTGLALALLSLDRLLNLKINEINYGRLFFITAFIFHPWFFLAGVPKPGGRPAVEVPAGLRRFVQFVLVPLVSIYLAILYLYTSKILISWQLPNGWVALPVLALGVIGVLATLLIAPLRDDNDHRWAGVFIRWFHRLLLPLAVLLMVSIGVRIHEHGVTESRYFVTILAGWLFVTAFIYGWTRRRTILWIPVSLGVLCVLASLGPWSASSISGRSQMTRVLIAFKELQILHDGRLIPKPQTIPAKTYENLNSKIRYIIETHGYHKFESLFDNNPRLTEPVPDYRSYNLSLKILDHLGLKSAISEARSYGFTLKPIDLISTGRGGHASVHQYYSHSGGTQPVLIGSDSTSLAQNSAGAFVLRSKTRSTTLSWRSMLDSAIKAYEMNHDVTSELLTHTVQLDETAIQLTVIEAFIQKPQLNQYDISNLRVLVIVYTAD